MRSRNLMHTGIIRMLCFHTGPALGLVASQTHPFRGYLHGVLSKLQNAGVHEMQLSIMSWANCKRVAWAHSRFTFLNPRIDANEPSNEATARSATDNNWRRASAISRER
jgi:hypothetical protein